MLFFGVEILRFEAGASKNVFMHCLCLEWGYPIIILNPITPLDLRQTPQTPIKFCFTPH